MKGGGFSDYSFPRKNETNPLPKRSYSLYTPSFKWIVGTGNYINDIQEEVNKLRDNDPEFRQWLGMTELMGAAQVPGFCMQKVGTERASSLLNELMLKRENLLRSYFAEKGVPE